jgi:peptidoglycan/LPS O-acetylase OafA/YrhL
MSSWITPILNSPDQLHPNRLRQLDFLRGLAIFMVLFRHQYLDQYTHRIGWMGVDLFFVLSGFLVSGLLFREYAQHGSIKPGLFLIRRGFKIYPIYYLFYLLYLLPILYKGNLDFNKFLGDMLFVQNYVSGWGYAYAPSWSLAVEEHFYVMLTLLLVLASGWGWLNQKGSKRVFAIEWVIMIMMVVVLLLRMDASMRTIPFSKLITMTHLRIDSLLAGVLISFWFHYRHQKLCSVFLKYKRWFLLVSFLLLLFSPFQDYTEAIWVRTIGFTVVYISFGIWLIWFLTDPKINQTLNAVFSKSIVDAMARIGVASYAVYIIHSFVNQAFTITIGIAKITVPSLVSLMVTSSISLVLGWLITKYIESYFLDLRNRLFPARAK